MARGDARLAEQSLEEVQSQFQAWRQQRPRGQRIPEELWQASAALYPRYSIYKIARALRLDHMDLKQRINRFGNSRSTVKHEAQFIELPFSNAVAHAGECTVKVKARRGSRIHIKVKGTGVGAVLEALTGLLSDSR